jgi:Protein of unknown function (DUF2911)
MRIQQFAVRAVTVFALGAGLTSTARADESNKLTYITFSQAVAIPGKVLPAGTYTFQLADSLSNRHIVQIFNRSGSQLIATIMAVPDSRLTPTDDTVITFNDRSDREAGTPPAITHWFYPGDTGGQEFAY